MQQKPSVSSKNRILSRLSADDKAFLKPDLEPVDLALRQVLETPNKPIKHSYFIEYGLASIVASNGHVWTAPGWQVKTSRRSIGRCCHVSGLLMRRFPVAAGHNALREIGSRSKARSQKLPWHHYPFIALSNFVSAR
jgi:hypothetical protein